MRLYKEQTAKTVSAACNTQRLMEFAATGSLELGVLPASSGAKSIVKQCSSGDWFDAMLCNVADIFIL